MKRSAFGFLLLILVVRCSSSSENTTDESCSAGDTKACTLDGCAASRLCDATTGKFLACACNTGGTGGTSGSGGGGAAGTGAQAATGGTDASTDSTDDASDAGVFDVCSISGCKLCLRADQGVTGTSLVTQWQDSSGNGNHAQASAGTEPQLVAVSSLDGRPAISFSSANQGQRLEGVTDVVPPGALRTVVLIGTISDANGGTYFTFRKSANLSAFQHFLYNGTDYLVHTDGTSTNHAAGTAVAFPPVNQKFVSIATTGNTSGAWMTLRFNGVEKTVTPNTAALTDNGSSGFMVGARETGDPGQSWDGLIAELVVFDKALTSVESTAIETYAQQHYGIVF